MRPSCAALILLICLSPAGCRRDGAAAPDLPQVTLTARTPKETTVMLRFCFTGLDSVQMKNRVLKAALVKSGNKALQGAAVLGEPGGEFSITVGVGKFPDTEGVFFVPMWGKSLKGAPLESKTLDLPGPDGETNRVSVRGAAGRRITQILHTCTGPDRPAPFDPARGIDLVTVGTAPEAYVLRVWAE